MLPVLEKPFSPMPRAPEGPATGKANISQEIAVIFTTIESTLSALKEAAVLASRLNGHLTLIVPQIRTYPTPLTSRTAPPHRPRRSFRVVAGERSVETSVRVCSCRTPENVPESALEPHSVVVIGRSSTGWLTRESRMARRLRRAGFEVVLAKTHS